MGLIVFLDNKRYPNADKVLKLLRDKTSNDVVTMELESQAEEITGILTNEEGAEFFTLVPNYMDYLVEAELGKCSWTDNLSHDSLKEVKAAIRDTSPDLGVRRMKLTAGDLDPLALADLYNQSPSLSVKIQTTGLPLINKYSGMGSFLSLNELNAGIVTPATKAETDSVMEDVDLGNEDYILQVLDNNLIFLHVLERSFNGLSWYEVEEIDIPSYIKDFFERFQDRGSYFAYLKPLTEYKISALFSGINYHVPPNLYIK